MKTDDLEKVAEENRKRFMTEHGFPEDTEWIEYAVRTSRMARLRNCPDIGHFLLLLAEMTVEDIIKALGVPPTSSQGDLRIALIAQMIKICEPHLDKSI